MSARGQDHEEAQTAQDPEGRGERGARDQAAALAVAQERDEADRRAVQRGEGQDLHGARVLLRRPQGHARPERGQAVPRVAEPGLLQPGEGILKDYLKNIYIVYKL